MLRSPVVPLLERLRPVAVFFLIGLVLLSGSRLGLACWHAQAVTAVRGWAPVLLQGLRVDVATLCLLYGIAGLLALLMPVTGVIGRFWKAALRVWLTLVTCVLAFMELATPDFMTEYGLRPNRLFVEYLIYPREVASMLLKGHAFSLCVGIAVVALLGWGAWRLAGRVLARPVSGRAHLLWRLPAAFVLLVLVFIGVRSTLGHRPLNPAMVAFSVDPTVNVLPLNSFYSAAYASLDLVRKSESSRLYGAMPLAQIVAELRAGGGLPASAYVSETLPTLAARPASYSGRPRNLVIVLEESLGAQFIGSLGGLPLSPNYDRLSGQGWAFDRLYATGTRSVRGIEAVVTGFTPTPAEAVVKQSGSQSNFFTVAQLLGRRGYDATFYYGGESHFDNMRGFFLGNGFNRIIDQKAFDKPAFTGSWGVSDEDLFARADTEFNKLHAQGKPFFGLVFSSSNHDPFEFPDGRIDLYEQPKQTRNNAAKYADYAIGEFFKKAMASPYWNDTVFLVVADHDSRVFGKNLVPISNFHIPGLILGGGIAPRRDDRIVSQVDLAPTLLSLMGIDDPTPMVGQDLTDPSHLVPGRALMQYDRNFALMRGNDVVILQPGKPAASFEYDVKANQLVPVAPLPELSRAALAHALWGTEAYEKGLYRLPPATR
ncbi:LTA synthase family protein [Pseudoxanthomonas sp.]|uniref:LTA synthase family protein n=1 Tax=Pseudoxanthomonas sp. TaxID=1871049 RepID=UPI00261E5FFB|nr:LTA synthase family protein [Pseudoxanthomonas sp.]WDS35739.1 MAG: LTA synthase family protein [Pseudoxanthomonas sp.]